MRFGVVAARFNAQVTSRLHASCLKTLRARGAGAGSVDTVWVPGSFEIPWAVHGLALSGRYDAVIAIGCILKGQTPQNDLIAASVAQSLQQIALATRVPCVFGVITPRTEKQALARTRGGLDRGKEAAEVALQMAGLGKALRVARSELRVRDSQPATRNA